MKKILWILTCCLIPQLVSAQLPKWVEKSRKAVFSIVTYDKDNKIKNTGNGFYIHTDGTALSDYSLFEGAEKAVIISADGKQFQVDRILGADAMYDVVKFITGIDKKQVTLLPASEPAKVGETVYLLPYSTQKATACQTGKVLAVDSLGNDSFYYTLEMATNEKTVSCPIMNASGQLLGMIQKNASNESKESYAIGATFGTSLHISALSINDGALNKIGIKKALPFSEDQALVYLIMAAGQMNEENYLNLLNDFIQQFPKSMEGYIRRSAYYMANSDASLYPLAEEDFKKVIEVADDKGEAKYQVAKNIYSYLISLGNKDAYSEWTYDRALSIVQEAMQHNIQPLYIQLEGDILYAKRDYQGALASYDKLNKTSLASAATFYSAAKTKQLIEGADMNEVLALMDSAIVRIKKPYYADSAPYFYERAELCAQMGRFRDAVIDYNTFYEAVSGDVSALFYFKREQAEMQCRMYQQGLDDINRAVEMAPEEVDFWVEKGSVHLRVNQLDDAVAAFNKAISMDAQYAAAYRMLGYCQALQKKNKEACLNFQKAKELGDKVVDQLIEKYCK